jgi:LysM repeat protein
MKNNFRDFEMFDIENDYGRYKNEIEFATIEGYNRDGQKIESGNNGRSRTIMSLFIVGTVGIMGYFGYGYIENETNFLQKTAVMGVTIKNSKEDTSLNREEIEKGLDNIYQEEQENIKLNKTINSVINEFVAIKTTSSSSKDISNELNGIVDMFYNQEAIPVELDNMVDSFYSEKLSPKEGRFITVKEGDTLAKISQKFYGSAMEYPKIVDANYRLKESTTLYIGQEINVPY